MTTKRRLPLGAARTVVMLVAVLAVAVGLNLSVMSLSGREPEAAGPSAPAARNAEPGDPEVIEVVVDVPIAAAALAPSTTTSTTAIDATSPPATDPPVATKPPPPPAPPPVPTTTPPPNPTPAPSSTAPTTTPPPAPTTTTTPSAPTTPPPPGTEYLTYTFEGVADIVIALHDDERLQFWSADPKPGWHYQVEKDWADKVELKFRRTHGEGEAKFLLELDDGELTVTEER